MSILCRHIINVILITSRACRFFSFNLRRTKGEWDLRILQRERKHCPCIVIILILCFHTLVILCAIHTFCMYLFITLKLIIMYHQRYIGLFSFRGKLAARRRHPQRKVDGSCMLICCCRWMRCDKVQFRSAKFAFVLIYARTRVI